jgi:hypothetical protein
MIAFLVAFILTYYFFREVVGLGLLVLYLGAILFFGCLIGGAVMVIAKGGSEAGSGWMILAVLIIALLWHFAKQPPKPEEPKPLQESETCAYLNGEPQPRPKIRVRRGYLENCAIGIERIINPKPTGPWRRWKKEWEAMTEEEYKYINAPPSSPQKPDPKQMTFREWKPF